MLKPVIVVIAYDREKSLERLLSSVARAKYEYDDIPLIISIDHSANNEKVTEVAESFFWEYGKREIVQHESNIGLRNHVLECGAYAERYGAVILLEDDLFVAEDYYSYAVATQEYYADEKRLAGVSLYSYERNNINRAPFSPLDGKGDVYMAQFCVTWGQCWTKDQWMRFREWYDNHQTLFYSANVPKCITNWSDKSWGKFFAHYMVDQDVYYAIPYVSRSTCFSEKGVHTGMTTSDDQVRLSFDTHNYRYDDFDNCVKYDVFYNNKELAEKLIKEYEGSRVCLDLYSTLDEYKEDVKYLLTTKRISKRVVKSYGAQLRPLELNVMYEIPGNDIFLYDYQTDDKKPADNSYNLLLYKMRGFNVKQATEYAVRRGINYIREMCRKK